MNNYRTIQQKDMHKLFPAWEHNIPTLGTKHSHVGNKKPPLELHIGEQAGDDLRREIA